MEKIVFIDGGLQTNMMSVMNLEGVSKNCLCILIYGFEKGNIKDKQGHFFPWVLCIVLSIELELASLCPGPLCEILPPVCMTAVCEQDITLPLHSE